MTAATKARPKGKQKRANIVEAMNGIFRPWFPPVDTTDTWSNWKAVLKAMDGLPMNAEEIDFFKSIAGDREPPGYRSWWRLRLVEPEKTPSLASSPRMAQRSSINRIDFGLEKKRRFCVWPVTATRPRSCLATSNRTSTASPS